jgi:hypothetical protein
MNRMEMDFVYKSTLELKILLNSHQLNITSSYEKQSRNRLQDLW